MYKIYNEYETITYVSVYIKLNEIMQVKEKQNKISINLNVVMQPKKSSVQCSKHI